MAINSEDLLGNNGTIIGEMKEIYSSSSMVETNNEKWLNSEYALYAEGNFPDGVYPEAETQNVTSDVYLRAVTLYALMTGIEVYDDELYILKGGTGTTGSHVYKHRLDGSFTGDDWSVRDQTLYARGICTDNKHFWVITSEERVYKYELDGTYTGVEITLVGVGSNHYDLCWDGTHFWVLDLSTKMIYQHTAEWVYTGLSYVVDGGSSNTSLTGLSWDGNYFWVNGLSADTAYRFGPDGVQDVGVQVYFRNQDTNVYSQVYYRGIMFAVGQFTFDLLYYKAADGLVYGLFNATEGPSGSPLFTRIE